MKTKIFISLFLLISVTSFILYRPAERTNTADVSTETIFGNSYGKFLIGAMQSINDENSNYVHYDSLGLDMWHTYTGTSDIDPVTNQRYPFTNMASNDSLLIPVSQYAGTVQSKINNIYSHNQSRLILMRPKIEWLCYGQRSDYQCEDGHRDTALWFYSFQSAGHNGGIDSQDFRYADGNWVRYFRSQNSTNGGAWVDNIGTVISKLKANTEQCRKSGTDGGNIWQTDEQWDWYIKPRIRIDSNVAHSSLNPLVCKIKVIAEDGSIILKEVNIKANYFLIDPGRNYNGRYIDNFDLPIDTNLTIPGAWGNNKAYWQARGNRTTLGSNDNKMDIQVYWYGNCDMWIDYIRVDNEVANDLFSLDPGNSQHLRYESWLDSEVTQIGLYTPVGASSPAAYKFYIELTEFNNFPCMAYVNKKIKQYSSNELDLITDWTLRNSIHVPWENRSTVMTADFIKRFYIDSVGFQMFFTECYPYNSDSIDPATSNTIARIPNTLPVTSCGGSGPCGILAYPIPPADFDDWLQDNMDHEPFYFTSDESFDLTKYLWARGISKFTLDLGDKISKAYNIPFVLMPQSHSWYSPNVEIHNEPTNEELDLQANLAVSYGVRGLMYFAWDSKGNPGDLQYHRALTELDGTLRRKNIYGQDKTKKQTMIDLINRMKKWEPYIMSFDNANRKSYIYRIPAERTDMNNYTFIRDMSTFPVDPLYYPVPEADELELETNNDTYLQASFFQKETETELNKYFMIINRRCSPFVNYNTANNIGGKRFVFMRVNSTNLQDFNNWKIIDLENGDSVLTFNKNDTAKYLYLGEFAPGEGRLYRVAPVMQEGGTLVTDEECGGDIECKGEVNNNGKNIFLKPGTNISFTAHTARIKMTGGVFKSGYSLTESAPVYLKGKDNSNWKGILLSECDSVLLRQTHFRNISPYPVDSTYALDMINCEFINIETGSFISEGDINAGCIRSGYVTNEDVDYSACIQNNSFETDEGEIPALSFIATAGLSLPLIINGNTFTTASSNNSSNAILLNNIIGGVIKNNTVSEYINSIIMLSSSMDLYNNTITSGIDNSAGIQLYSFSTAFLKPSGMYYTGGYNDFTNLGDGSRNIELLTSYFNIYKGYNVFNVESNSDYHLIGSVYLSDLTNPTQNAKLNCFQFDGTNTPENQGLVWDNTGMPAEYIFTPYSCEIDEPIAYEVFNFGDRVKDTIYIEESGTGGGKSNYELGIKNYELKAKAIRSESKINNIVENEEIISLESLADSIGINIRRRNYEKVSEDCMNILTNYPDSLESIGIISKLYLADLRIDSAGNKMSELKTFFESLILNHPNNTALVKQAFYYIQKCKVSLKQYESAMTGFLEIMDENPYSYEGLVASWDFSATSLLFEGQGGAGGGISNFKLQISNDGSKEDERENGYDEKSQIFSDDPNDKYDTKLFSIEDRKIIKENVFNSFELSREKETEIVRSLEKKFEEGKASKEERTELEKKKTLSETVKARKPANAFEHIKFVNNDIQIVFGVSGRGSDKEPDNIFPNEYSLSQNYPNPFNPLTHLEFEIPDLGYVSLKVYDVLGRELKTLVNEIKPAGTYKIEFDGSNFASGVYFYRIEAGEFVQTKRMVLIK